MLIRHKNRGQFERALAQRDPRATAVEQLRWADALGLLSNEFRPGKLDRHTARLAALKADLAYLRTRGELASEPAQARRDAEEFAAALETVEKSLPDPGAMATMALAFDADETMRVTPARRSSSLSAAIIAEPTPVPSSPGRTFTSSSLATSEPREVEIA